MTTFDYIKDLEFLLQDKIPNEKMKIILEKYTMFLENELKSGKTEDEIILSLGSPDEVADLFLTKQNENSEECKDIDIFKDDIDELTSNKITTQEDLVSEQNKKSIVLKKILNSSKYVMSKILKFAIGVFLALIIFPLTSIVLFTGIAGLIFSSVLAVILFTVTIFLTNTAVLCSILSILLVIFLSTGLISLSLLVAVEFIKYFFLENRLESENNKQENGGSE